MINRLYKTRQNVFCFHSDTFLQLLVLCDMHHYDRLYFFSHTKCIIEVTHYVIQSRCYRVNFVTDMIDWFLIFVARKVSRYQREVIRIRNSKKDRQHNDQKKKDKQLPIEYFVNIENENNFDNTVKPVLRGHIWDK